MTAADTPKRVESSHLPDGNIAHGFFTRIGGVSKGDYSSLNVGLGSDDDREAIAENRARICRTLKVEPQCLAAPFQVHSPEVVVADKAWNADNRPKADAVVTAQKNLAVGILTADCGPVLFADEQAGVIAAAHAGWQGALSGVLENTIAKMEDLGAKRTRIKAVLGPLITQLNYQVGPEFHQKFCQQDASFARYFVTSSKPDHHQFDLPGFIVDRLKNAGIDARFTGHCTYALEDEFFSYRRATHRGENSYGRQISTIVRHG